MMTRSLSHMDRLIVSRLPEIRALPFDVVVHLPRSGTIPAALIATYLRRPLASLEEFCRGIVSTRKSETTATRRVLLVDDSIRTGIQMRHALQRLRAERPDARVLTLAVYSTDFPRTLDPTIILDRHAEDSYIYPWFMWKTKRVRDVAFDMDGVLCRDCSREEDDDGEEYAKFLAHAAPKFLTEYELGAIITSRLEKYRPQTEAWLKQHGFKYRSLVMGPWATPEERRGNAAKWKADEYAKSDASLYVESDDRTARLVAAISGKPTWSIETMERHE